MDKYILDSLSENDRKEIEKFQHYLRIQSCKKQVPAEGLFALNLLEQIIYPEQESQ